MDIAIFIDGSNMFFAQKMQGWNMDYEKVYKYFKADHNISGAYYFAAYSTEPQKYKKYRRFREFLIHTGYEVIDKEVHTIKDERTGREKQKGNLDIELCFKMLTTYTKWEKAILLGVDVDFIPVVNHIRRLSKTITVVGNKNMTSLDMRNSSDHFIDLEDIRISIERSASYKKNEG